MRVLVACEFSGVVRDAFDMHGHYAMSCDLIDSERPGEHYIGDVMDIIDSDWDLILAFPPCTHLASAGARWFKDKKEVQEEALDFVIQLMSADCPRIMVENPVGIIGTQIRKADQVIQPWEHGHREQKQTCLWLKGLPLLQPSNVVVGRKQRIQNIGQKKDRWKERSRTLPGIAKAMGEQWG